MSYQALYRRFRPRTFQAVAGQDHITRILRNQVAGKMVSHAYLFSGSRGTGKTSTAKIFARAINCLAPEAGEPCGRCAACAADTVDILEIDAASNNGVDEIRDLREKAQFLPLSSAYKVYIIDEVHMLTASAFNALLKTLEEPPPFVVFILATTEAQKIPATILSRCQRFEFRRIATQEITARLQEVLTEIKVPADEEALAALARASEGSLRDALSLADQCLSPGLREITAADVYDILGSMDPSFFFRIAGCLLASDAPGALALLDEAFMAGKELGVLLRDLAGHFRNLLLSAMGAELLLDVSGDARTRFHAQAQGNSARALRAMNLLAEAEAKLRYAALPRVLVESALVRICLPQDETGIPALLDRIETLERRLTAAPLPSLPEAAAIPPEAPAILAEPEKTPPVPAEAEPLPRAATAIPAPAPAEEPPSKTQSSPIPPEDEQAATLWANILRQLEQKNRIMYIKLKKCTNIRLHNGTLFAEFPADSGGKAFLQQCADYVNPMLEAGLRVHFTLRENDEAARLAEEARALFGNQLIVRQD